jgi:hypothetical protein
MIKPGVIVLVPGDKAQRGHQTLLGKGGNRGLVGGIELDPHRRDAEQHGNHTVTAGEPTDGAAVAIDQHGDSFSPLHDGPGKEWLAVDQ